jgi:heme/copper-type cytochrome/quinol oxidase subunit 2
MTFGLDVGLSAGYCSQSHPPSARWWERHRPNSKDSVVNVASSHRVLRKKREKLMRSNFACYLYVSMLLFSATTQMFGPKSALQTSSQEQQERNAHVIQMTAKKYEYSPSPLHIKQGTRVELKITSIDRDHGFAIATVPDDTDPTGPAGLELTLPQPRDGWKLRKGRETTIEFVAKTVGTYGIRCSVACGFGHGRMKGQLVVDP